VRREILVSLDLRVRREILVSLDLRVRRVTRE